MKPHYLLFIVCYILVESCRQVDDPLPISTNEVAVLWGQMTLKTMTKLPMNTPTYASRALGYMGLTMYESVVAGSGSYRSLAGQLNGINILPEPKTGQTYNWVLSLNAGQAFMLKKQYDYADKYRQYSIDSLEYEIVVKYSKNQPQDITDRSIAYGKAVANALFEYSKTDGGYQGYLQNFDQSYVFPTAAGNWVPPTKGQTLSRYPLHPYWGKNRTFVLTNAVLPVPQLAKYSSDKQSIYYQQFDEVYQKSKTLTQAEKDLAAWWADDPTETFSPPGHSYSLANIIVKTVQPDMFKATEIYARVGMGVADAFINCWKTKYSYHCERPSTYIRAYIDPNWEQFWPEPPFPAFYSGHSVQAAATATILEDLYGKSFNITDNSHEGRQDEASRGVNYKTRTYTDFWATAQEAAQSRFLGGIHTRQDNEIGLIEGQKIGTNINNLNWKKQ